MNRIAHFFESRLAFWLFCICYMIIPSCIEKGGDNSNRNMLEQFQKGQISTMTGSSFTHKVLGDSSYPANINRILKENLHLGYYEDIEESQRYYPPERIRGIAVVRNAPEGYPLFSLFGNTIVECGKSNDKWYNIGLIIEIDSIENERFHILPGRWIPEGGWAVNKVRFSSVFFHEGKYFAWITGYTFVDNIYPESVVEKAIENILNNLDSDRNINDVLTKIEDCRFTKSDQLNGYEVYFNYETRLIDPSPSYRVMLIFEDDLLIAVLNSRDINLTFSSRYDLPRNYTCHIFPEARNPKGLLEALQILLDSID